MNRIIAQATGGSGTLDAARVVLLVVAIVLPVLIVLRLILRSVARGLQAEVDRRFRRDEIVKQEIGANFFGLESRGVRQLRGNGALVLTSEMLWFRQALSNREICIPLDRITRVSSVPSHLGKTIIKPLLRVDFIDSNESCDSVAWAVRDTTIWQEAVKGKQRIDDDGSEPS